MPGFQIDGTGDGPSNTVDLLFSHRWKIVSLGDIDENDCKIAQTFNIPDIKFEKQEILGGTVYYKFAKSVRYDDAVITFYDDGEFFDKLRVWKDLVYTSEDGIKSHKPSGGYKKNVELEMLDEKGDTSQSLQLKNAWPSSINLGKLSYTDSSIKLITISLTFDELILNEIIHRS